MRCGLIECARNQGGLCLIAGQVSLNEHGTCWYAANAIEAEPVRHGRWVERPNTKGQVYCSECGTLEKTTDNNFKSMHCPHCGAKMDGDDDATN